MSNADSTTPNTAMVKLTVRVPPEIDELIRQRAEERAQTFAEYAREALSARPAEVHQALLLNARYTMALEAIIKLGSSYNEEYELAKLALGQS
jgi:hypothetical protein